jgi:hypothetical protein
VPATGERGRRAAAGSDGRDAGGWLFVTRQ